jgi:hypothetical protein
MPYMQQLLADLVVSPPYTKMDEMINDLPRQYLRRLRMRVGLPTSKDVGIIAVMLAALRDKALALVGEPISTVAISIPYIPALYGEDLSDACKHVGLFWLEDFDYSARDMEATHATKAVYADSGLALCKDYKDVKACSDEEQSSEARWALSAGYTEGSLLTHLAFLGSYDIEESAARPDAMTWRIGHAFSHTRNYWEGVREELRAPIIYHPLPRNVSLVLLYGEPKATDDPRFREVLGEVIDEYIGVNGAGDPQIFDRDPEFSAAKGAAELAKRDIFRRKQAQAKVSDL